MQYASVSQYAVTHQHVALVNTVDIRQNTSDSISHEALLL